MNIIDTILLIFIFTLLIYGFVKGFVCFLTRALAVIGTVVLGWLFGDMFGIVLNRELGVSLLIGRLISYAIIFLAVVILLKIFRVYINKGMDYLDLGIYDRVLGAIFVVLFFLGLISLIFVGIRLFFDHDLLQNQAVASSRILGALFDVIQRFYPDVL